LWALKLNQENRLKKLNKDQVTYNDEIRVANNLKVTPNVVPSVIQNEVNDNFYIKSVSPNRQQIVSEEISEVI
jgi:hypothetical protein